MSGEGFEDDVRARTMAAIMAVWQGNKAVYIARVAALVRAAEALRAGALSPEARASAADEAHLVAGAVGSFGFPAASQAAKDMERLLRAERPLTVADGELLAELAEAARAELDPR